MVKPANRVVPAFLVAALVFHAPMDKLFTRVRRDARQPAIVHPDFPLSTLQYGLVD
jgi:hypothetical protein